MNNEIKNDDIPIGETIKEKALSSDTNSTNLSEQNNKCLLNDNSDIIKTQTDSKRKLELLNANSTENKIQSKPNSNDNNCNAINDEIEILDHSQKLNLTPNSNNSNDSNQDILINTNQFEINNSNTDKHTNNNTHINIPLSISINQIHLKEVWAYFSHVNIDKERTLIVVENFNKGNFIHRLFTQCSKDYILLPQLKEERIRIFSIAKINYDKDNINHTSYLNYIYQFLQQESNPKQYAWELIGFQGEPQNDFRSVGMMGVVQMIALIDKYAEFTLDFFTYLESIQSEWIFAILLLNMTKLTLDLLKKGVLIAYCNNRKSVLETLNDFYIGLVYQLNKELLSEEDNIVNEDNKLTIDYMSSLVFYLKEFAYKNPGHFFWNENQLLKSYSSSPGLITERSSPGVKEIDKLLK